MRGLKPALVGTVYVAGVVVVVAVSVSVVLTVLIVVVAYGWSLADEPIHIALLNHVDLPYLFLCSSAWSSSWA